MDDGSFLWFAYKLISFELPANVIPSFRRVLADRRPSCVGPCFSSGIQYRMVACVEGRDSDMDRVCHPFVFSGKRRIYRVCRPSFLHNAHRSCM